MPKGATHERKGIRGLDGIDLPGELLEGIAGGVLDEDQTDWLISLIDIAKRAGCSREGLLARVKSAYNDPSEAQELEEVLAFINANW